MGGKRTVITAEEVELHNEAGGFWTIVNGKVYDLESAERSCISERLSEYAGKDATKEFDDADHSDIAMALVEKCLVGDYTERGQTQSEASGTDYRLSSILVDTERTLAVLQGLRASLMVHSIPVSPEEEESEKWLSTDIFSGGFELQPFTSQELYHHGRTDKHPATKRFVSRTFSQPLSLDANRAFIAGFVNSDVQDEKVTVFLSLVHRYCRHRNLVIPSH
ncbi:E3 ubiquitin-protein ligase HERC2 [Geodia barretti]|uniref:E3 ubiquitin-protein ligase HERC2 n=1 Tax=Geodia barretti TaxID=519541 RepID=A0AA35WTG4_GEOBA|nr:E3 ubiquitin-protein ligase HERC2 [Geodia barretti]